MFAAVPVAKFALTIATSIGVGKIVGGVVKNNTEIVTPVAKVTVGVASFVLGSMIVEQTSAHIDNTFEAAKASWNKIRKNDEETPEETE